MITIDQLLESLDLDFEPRWVTKDEDGCIAIWDSKKPSAEDSIYLQKWLGGMHIYCPKFKVAEFSDNDWQECIYEVPRKTTGKIEKITGVLSTVNGKRKIVFPSDVSQEDIISKLHELVDAVNELKGANNEAQI